MTKERMKTVWETLIAAYKATVEYTSHGTTGDPRKTIAEAVSRGVTKDELRQVLAVIAHVKEHDGRFSLWNRRWLYESLDFGSDDWYMEYGCYMKSLDDIHTSHLDYLVTILHQVMREEGA